MLIVSYPVDIEPFLKSLVVTISNLKNIHIYLKRFIISWLRSGKKCPSGRICLPVNCYFSESEKDSSACWWYCHHHHHQPEAPRSL